MGQKDITEKQLEDYNDVFADIYNVLVFEKDVIDESRLRDGTTESHYRDGIGMCRDQRRDVMKTYLDEYRMELAFITAFTNDPRYENAKEDLEELKQKGEKVVMCEYLDMYIEEGEQRGLQAGRKEGEQMMVKLMECLLADNLTEEMRQVLIDDEARAKLYVKYGITEVVHSAKNVKAARV